MKESQPRKYPKPDVKRLFSFAAGRCAFPDCRELLFIDATGFDDVKAVGKIAHIIAHNKEGPRYDAKYPQVELDRYDNWILLCGPHHDTVDLQFNTYTTEYLRNLKKDHEKWVQARLDDAMPAVSFAELQVITEALAGNNVSSPFDATLIKPADKMVRNQLSNRSEHHLVLALGKAKDVRDYISAISKVDAGFINRLADGLRSEYMRLKAEDGLSGDDLFNQMYIYTSHNSMRIELQAAGLAVLGYFFEVCEVFER